MADFETYCSAPEGDEAVHICGVYEITNEIVTGVDTFFLIFAVSSSCSVDLLNCEKIDVDYFDQYG